MRRKESRENVWERYEAEKQMIYATSKSSEEYTRRIAELVKRLGL